MFFDYTKVLLYYQTNGTCLNIAEMLEDVAHDSITRFLKKDWSGQKRLEMLFSKIPMKRGYLILDDTVIAKPDAKAMEMVQKVYDTKLSKTVLGYVTVLLLWSDGVIRIPIGMRIWHPGEKSKIELALDLLSYARNQLKLKPQFVFFDSWYAAQPILKRVHQYGWGFVTRIKSNRLLDGRPLGWRNHWQGIGRLRGGVKVHVIKHDGLFFATNRILLHSAQIRSFYSGRSTIEEVFRILKQELCFGDCTVRSILAQEHHQWCALFAFIVLELERIPLNMTIYKLRTLLCKRDSTLSLPLFEQLSATA